MEDDKRIISKKEGSNGKERKGLRMQEGSIPEEEYEFGVLHEGRKYKRKNPGAEKRESRSNIERREPCKTIQIVEIPYIGGEEEDFQSSLLG